MDKIALYKRISIKFRKIITKYSLLLRDSLKCANIDGSTTAQLSNSNSTKTNKKVSRKTPE